LAATYPPKSWNFSQPIPVSHSISVTRRPEHQAHRVSAQRKGARK
jgi:hypothetical protein